MNPKAREAVIPFIVQRKPAQSSQYKAGSSSAEI
jgi:hypothetical protein